MPRVTVYNPREGKFEVEIPLPVKVRSLEDLYNRMEPRQLTDGFERFTTSFSDLFKRDGPISQELQTRKGIRRPKSAGDDTDETHRSTAYILDDGRHSNILTFDGHSYSVSHACKLLLAGDFVDDRFTIQGQFHHHQNKMHLRKLTFTFKDVDIDITDDGKVLIDGTEVELPWQKMDEFQGTPIVSVKRKDHGVVVRTFDGIVLKRDWYYAITAVSLPGYYHGHSTGVLGSNDNEHANDIDLPNGDGNEDMGAFLDAYRMDDTCDVKPLGAHQLDKPQFCEDMFRMRQSPLKTGFRRVPPGSFYNMCTESSKCNVTAAYIAACTSVGIELDMPEECLSCTAPNSRVRRHSRRSVAGGFTGGQTRRLESTIVKNVDVVFVVMEQPQMQFVREKILDAAQKITETLSGFNSVRFGVIGFHGTGVHNKPHFHTGNYKINFDMDGLRKAVAELDFSDLMEDAEEQDPLAAVDFTTMKYPFRPAALKTIILWTGIQCGTQANYYDTQQELLQRGVQLHVMTARRIVIDQPHDGELMGFDATRMFTTSGNKPEWREALTAPHDACTVLAQETNGTVWTVADRQAAIVTTPAEKIAERIQQLHSRTPCVECECDSMQLAPRTVCYPCDVPMPVSMSDRSFYNIPYINLQSTLRKAQKKFRQADVWML
jgi:hypothetical protein